VLEQAFTGQMAFLSAKPKSKHCDTSKVHQKDFGWIGKFDDVLVSFCLSLN